MDSSEYECVELNILLAIIYRESHMAINRIPPFMRWALTISLSIDEWTFSLNLSYPFVEVGILSSIQIIPVNY